MKSHGYNQPAAIEARMTTLEMKVYFAGHWGMVGSAILRRFEARKHVGEEIEVRTSADLDLTDQATTRAFLQAEKPDVVILAVARVGGILANNTYPAEFIYVNLMISTSFSSAPRAIIRSSRPSRWPRTRFSRARSSPPTSPTPSPR